MNFRKLEVTGFKSFADRVELEFEPGITAIVGPNGCGKSNIADAIKWALGEQNARGLRCEKMEDIIFNGGSSRRPLGMAQVSLIISNPDKLLPTDYTEVEIERRFFRSGESEYYMNRNRCLLKDIQELFMDTGLGVNSYSIMEQGHIDIVLNSSPQERRLILEEAAGITKFRHRKKTALKKLEITEQNILRINDILHELEQQVASLKRQESKARTYQRYYAELKELDTHLSRRRYHNMMGKLSDIQDSIARLEDKARSISADATKLEAESETLRLNMTELEEKLTDLRTNARKVQTSLEETESKIAVLKERRANLYQQRQKAEAEISKAEKQISELEKEIALINNKKNQLLSVISQWQGELNTTQEAVNALTDLVRDEEKSIEELKAHAIELLNKKAKVQNELSATNSRLDYLTKRLERLNVSAENFREELSQLKENLAKLQESASTKESEISALMALREKIDSQISGIESELSLLEKDIREMDRTIQTKSSRLQSLQELRNAHEGYSAGAKAVLQRNNETEPALKGICGVIAEIIKTEPQYEPAIEAGFGSNIQCIVTETIEDAKSAVEYLKDSKAGRATFLPREFLKGPALMNIKAEDSIPLNELKDKLLDPIELLPRSDVPELESVISALTVVDLPPDFAVVRNLLRNILIVKDLDSALKLSALMREGSQISDITFVTLDGQVVSTSGTITGGAGSADGGLLRREREINELEKEVEELGGQLKEMTGKRDELSLELSALQIKKSETAKEIQSGQIAQTGMQKDISQLEVRVTRLEKELSTVETEEVSLKGEIAKLEGDKAKLTEDIERFEKESEELDRKINELQKELRSKTQQRDALMGRLTEVKVQLAANNQQEKGLTENLSALEQERTHLLSVLSSYQKQEHSDDETVKELSQEISLLEAQLEELFGRRSKIEDEISGLESQRQKAYNELAQGSALIKDYRHQLDQLKQERYQLEVMKTQIQMNMDALISKMQERYGIPIDKLQEQESESQSGMPVSQSTQALEMSEEEIENRIEELRTRMERLGPVNLTAVDEYNRQKERYDLMVAQRDDLLKAKDSLYSLIQRINKESRERLKETFDRVNASFQELFQRLFGGGHAELVMIGEEDVLDSGIELIARPPGKKPQAVSMLSTGERALTAIALLFALFKIKPSPFCIMDEVDAALDDANVGRFTDMLKEFSKDIQFVIITHNKRTMEIADILYGVTMEESGVSRLVSLRMDKFQPQSEPAVHS